MPYRTAPIRRMLPNPGAITEVTQDPKGWLEQQHNRIQEMPEPPENQWSGVGVVLVGGGMNYTPGAWVVSNLLRHVGVDWPIQVWAIDQSEIIGNIRELSKPLNVEWVDSQQFEQQSGETMRIVSGWTLKAYAILNCPFRHVLFLDADCIPVCHPDKILHSPEYQETGGVFFADPYYWIDPDAWKRFVGEPLPRLDVEAGQFMVDKVKLWKMLHLTKAINDYSDFWYEHFYGDKEALSIAIAKMENKPIICDTGKMLRDQFGKLALMEYLWLDHTPLFQHIAWTKFDFHPHPKKHERICFYEEQIAAINQLSSNLQDKPRRSIRLEGKTQLKRIRDAYLRQFVYTW